MNVQMLRLNAHFWCQRWSTTNGPPLAAVDKTTEQNNENTVVGFNIKSPSFIIAFELLSGSLFVQLEQQ